MDNNISLEQALELAKQNAINLSAVSDQMGIVNATMKRHDIEIRQNKEDIRNIRTDHEQFKEYMEESRNIDPTQAQELEQAVKSRAAHLLNEIGCSEEEFKKYFGKFTARCWNDAKNKRLVVGHKGMYTPRRNFEPSKNYINGWTPYKHGVQGYIDYLDRRNREKP